MTGWFRYVIVRTKFAQAAAADFPIWSHGARNGGRMKTAAIIAEYNPFHNGHAYHIEETRRQTGADFIIAAMSGDYVQRGAPALIDKYARTKMASRDFSFRDAYHGNIADYLQAVTPEEFERFIGDQSIDFDRILADNKDVLKRLKQAEDE